MAYDVAIIGGGVIGLAAAFELASRGAKTALLTNHKPGGSAAAAGMLSPAFEIGHDAADPAFAAVLREGLQLWDNFAERLAADPRRALGYRRDGVYGIGYAAAPYGTDVPPKESLPCFAARPAAFAPREGQVDPRLLLARLEAVFKERGGTVLGGEASLDGDLLRLDGEGFAADAILVAGGADRRFGPETLSHVRGRAILFRLKDQDRDAVPKVVRSPNVYFCPRDDGTLYVGATEEWPGAIGGTPEELFSDGVRLLPALARAERLGVSDGLRPFIRRGGPLVMRSEAKPRIVRAQGHHRNGILLAPWTALRAAALLGF